MILSVSRRTDIPAFYSKWFMQRLREGYVLVRNPMNYHQVSNVSLDPQVIDCIVFWTKNAAPLIPHLEEIRAKYPMYFQYTLNAYGKDIEPALPALESKLATFCSLSEQIGVDAVIWRYDPILISEKYTVAWHIEQFRTIAEALRGKTLTCVFSFIDIYEKVKRNIHGLGVRPCTAEEMDTIVAAFAAIAKQCHMKLCTCSETMDFDKYGVFHGCCIDGGLIEKLTGWTMKAKKDPNQRPTCGCLESVDIGQYNTCMHGCRYCYANFNPQTVITLSGQHDPASPFLVGHADASDKITIRKMKSLKHEPTTREQLSLF